MPPPEAPSPDLQAVTAARAAAVAVLARTLEVLDGRRPRGQLAGASVDCARLHRLHVQLRSSVAAEFFGTSVRGERVRALAGRLECREVRVSSPGTARRTCARWVVTEFAIV